MVRVSQPIPKIGDAAPWDFRRAFLRLGGNMTRCFADDLQQALDGQT